MVEALPRFAPALRALAAAHPGGAFYPAVAWSASGRTVTFYEAPDGGASVASSVYREHVEAASLADAGVGAAGTSDVGAAGAIAFNATTLDVVALLEAHARPDDYVVLRMDIEGAEYEVLRRLLVSGAGCVLLDELHVETHSQQFAGSGGEGAGHRAASSGLGRYYLIDLTLGWLLEGCAGGGPRVVLTQQRGGLPGHGTISQHVPGCAACAWTQESAWYAPDAIRT
jgi:FkbM family methyltransferase